MFLSHSIDRIDGVLIRKKIVVRRVKLHSLGAHLDISFNFFSGMVRKSRIDGAEREEEIMTLTELQYVFIGDKSSGDRTYFRQDHGFFDVMASKIACKFFRIDHLFVAFIVLGVCNLLIVMDPFMPVFFTADMNMKIDDFEIFHGLEL